MSLLATDANLTGLNFSQKDFRGVNLAGVNLSNANLTAAQLDYTTVFSGIDPDTLQRVGVNLSNLAGNAVSLTGPFPNVRISSDQSYGRTPRGRRLFNRSDGLDYHSDSGNL